MGIAQDLARTGIELPRLMTAGRWRSPRMPALYTRNESVAKRAVTKGAVAKGAVADFYGHSAGLIAERFAETLRVLPDNVEPADSYFERFGILSEERLGNASHAIGNKAANIPYL